MLNIILTVGISWLVPLLICIALVSTLLPSSEIVYKMTEEIFSDLFFLHAHAKLNVDSQNLQTRGTVIIPL